MVSFRTKSVNLARSNGTKRALLTRRIVITTATRTGRGTAMEVSLAFTNIKRIDTPSSIKRIQQLMAKVKILESKLTKRRTLRYQITMEGNKIKLKNHGKDKPTTKTGGQLRMVHILSLEETWSSPASISKGLKKAIHFSQRRLEQVLHPKIAVNVAIHLMTINRACVLALMQTETAASAKARKSLFIRQ